MHFHHHGYVSGDPRVQPAAGVGLDRPDELPDRMDVLIGIFYGTGVTQTNWGLMVFVMLGLGAVVFVVSLLWREHRTA